MMKHVLARASSQDEAAIQPFCLPCCCEQKCCHSCIVGRSVHLQVLEVRSVLARRCCAPLATRIRSARAACCAALRGGWTLVSRCSVVTGNSRHWVECQTTTGRRPMASQCSFRLTQNRMPLQMLFSETNRLHRGGRHSHRRGSYGGKTRCHYALLRRPPCP